MNKKYEDINWYHGKLSREQAEMLLEEGAVYFRNHFETISNMYVSRKWKRWLVPCP